jgi:histidinol-phosphate aminotransferase
LAVPRPPWPVGTLVLEAVRVCSAPAAVAEAAAAAAQTVRQRKWMIRRLAGLPGVTIHQPAAAPFLLLRVADGERVRTALLDAGIAVRRADTFPGLTTDHLRVAVRPPEVAAQLIDSLRAALC